MRFVLLLQLVSGALMACGDQGGGGPTASPETIHISAAVPPAFVAFRDGIDADWQPAVAKSPTTFEAEVHGPYLVTVVCDFGGGGWVTEQTGQTLDESHDLATFCGQPKGKNRVTGHMVQPGFVSFGRSIYGSNPADWNFEFLVPDGTYDLVAASSDRVAIRRGIAVSSDLVISPPLDMTQQGTPLVDVAFSAANATPGETLMAVVLLGAHDAFPLGLYVGPNTTAKAAPESVLAATDEQTVAMLATKGTALRSLRRPFRVGGDTSFVLPPPLGAVPWTIEQGQLTVSVTSRPERDYLHAVAAGLGANSAASVRHVLDLSAQYLDATGITRAPYVTDIPGYQPEWRIDFARPYTRVAEFERVEHGEITTNSVTETVDAAATSSR